MKLCYKKIDFNPDSIHDIELWDGEFDGKNIHDSYLKGLGFTLVYKDWPNAKLEYSIHYIDTELFSGITRHGGKASRSIDEVKKVISMYKEKVDIKMASIQGSKDIRNLINKVNIQYETGG